MTETCCECVFADGKVIRVRAFNYSCAVAIAAFYRMRFMGADSHRMLSVVSGKKIEDNPDAITMEHCMADDVAT